MAKVEVPNDYTKEFAKYWVPTVVEAALDLQRASTQYKHNQDPHIEKELEAVASLRMKIMCTTLVRFVHEYQIQVGIDADADTLERAADGVYESTDDATVEAPATSPVATDDAPATSLVSQETTEPPNVESDDPAMLVGLA